VYEYLDYTEAISLKNLGYGILVIHFFRGDLPVLSVLYGGHILAKLGYPGYPLL
jgi:hypothetical protein